MENSNPDLSPYVTAIRGTIVPAVLAALAFGCASAGSRDSTSASRLSTEPDSAMESSRAHPAAFGAAGAFSFGKPHSERPDQNEPFYFKKCKATGSDHRADFSKTSYDCNDRP